MSKTSRSGAEIVAETLGGYGVSHVFLVPSVLSKALVKMEELTPISRVVTHGEKAAAYMADGYARATGRPGVCMAQKVGAANLAAGLRDAFLGCAPVIAIAGGPYRTSRNRHQYQDLDDIAMVAPVTKAATRIDDVSMIQPVLRQAFRDATGGRPGPVFVEVEGHLGEVLENQTTDCEIAIDGNFAVLPPFRPAPSAESIAAAADILAAAAHPVLVIGGGARISGAGDALRTLAERFDVPLVTSMNGKALIPSGHPLNLGVVGTYSRESANRLLAEADVAFFVGSETGSQVTNMWRLPTAAARVVHLDLVGEHIGVNFPHTVGLLGDARTGVELLISALRGREQADRAAWLARAEQLKGEWYANFADDLHSDAQPIRPARLCGELSALLPSDALVVSDTGHAGMWTGGLLDLEHEAQDFIRAAGSLGWALPATLGAKCARPDVPVVGFMGDGGFYYHMAEIETALRRGINAVLVVNNNNSLNQYAPATAASYGGVLRDGHADMWKHRVTDIAAIAAAMGAASFRAEKASQIGSALEQAFAADRVAVVEVVTDDTAMAPLGYAP